MIFEVKSNKRIEALFVGWQETMIWSCLQNVMGHLYADSEEQPNCAMALQGGIEIQIDTKETERRKGLAYICGAKLISQSSSYIKNKNLPYRKYRGRFLL